MLFSFVSEHPGLRGRTLVAGAGDVNGDGLGDFLVGVSEPVYGGGFARLRVSRHESDPGAR